MKAIILCGYRQDPDRPLGLDGETPKIERVLRELISFGLEPVVVTAGDQADEQLRACPRIADGLLVFDRTPEANLASNLQAGLAAIDGESSYVFPVEIPVPPRALWQSLSQELWRVGFEAPDTAIQALDNSGAPCHYGFPLLITRSGNKFIQTLSNFLSLTDPRLQYRHLKLDLEFGL